MQWGKPPWTVDFELAPRPLPREVDFAVIGGGFTGLAASAWLRHLIPQRSVALLEAGHIGAGASGHTGGMALAESSAGDLPGLGDVLGGLSSTLSELGIDCDLDLPGTWEIGRSGGSPGSPISWSDSGTLRVVQQVPGGTVDPGKLLGGLARAAQQLGVLIYENTRVDSISFETPLRLLISGKQLLAQCVLIATNAQSLELSGMAGRAEPKFTLAVATEALTPAQFELLGLASRKPFYTIDLPYLWGRVLRSNGVVFGSGLIHLDDWHDLAKIDIASGRAAELIANLELRVRRLDPALKSIEFTHSWGGPILIAEQWRPVFMRHPQSRHVIVLGAFAGQGVALSVYLGRWAAEAMLARRQLPNWN
jgi:glycine/D-amino acid oxidase-like deaminating enzyme